MTEGTGKNVHEMLVEQGAVDETPIAPAKQPQARRNSLGFHLQHRPDVDDLVERNILHDSTVAPAPKTDDSKTAERKRMLETGLNEKIAKRPGSQDLVNEGVLKEDPVAARERYEEAMELEYAKREGGA